MNSHAPIDFWYLALVAIDPSWSVYAGTLDPSLYFFIILQHLQRNGRSGSYSRQSHVATKQTKPSVLSIYQRGAFVGRGIQGVVYEVVGHPNMVVKASPMRHSAAYDTLISEARTAKSASDRDIGPSIHEVSFDGHVVHIEDDKTTFPGYKQGMVMSVVMEKIEEIEKKDYVKHYVGIVKLLSLMKAAGFLAVDCFYGRSVVRQRVVAVDFGVTTKTTGDEHFCETLARHIESTPVLEDVVAKYDQDFGQDELSTNMVKPTLKLLQEIRQQYRKKAKEAEEKKRIEAEKKKEPDRDPSEKPNKYAYDRKYCIVGDDEEFKCQVHGYPDVVVTGSTLRNPSQHKNYIRMSKQAMAASDKGFGPKVYEIAFGDTVVNMKEVKTIPDFEPNMVISFAKEKVSKIEDKQLVDNYLGIVDVWKKLKEHKYYNDNGFFGISAKQGTVVCADFETFATVKTDELFLHALVRDICDKGDKGKHYEHVASKYVDNFPEDEMSQSILAKLPAAVWERRENPSDY